MNTYSIYQKPGLWEILPHQARVRCRMCSRQICCSLGIPEHSCSVVSFTFNSSWIICVCQAPGKELQWVSVVADFNSEHYPDSKGHTHWFLRQSQQQCLSPMNIWDMRTLVCIAVIGSQRGGLHVISDINPSTDGLSALCLHWRHQLSAFCSGHHSCQHRSHLAQKSNYQVLSLGRVSS